MIKIVNKGYTISVTSWENDGDNYATKSLTVETIKEAQNIHKLCTELFQDGCNNEIGIGNSTGDYSYRIQPYIDNNPELNLSKYNIIELA